MTHLQKLQARLLEREDTAVLISSAQNGWYLSSFAFSDGYLLIFANEAFLLTDARYVEAARAGAPDFCVLCPDDMTAEIAGLLAERGVKTLLFEEAALTVAAKARLAQKWQGVAFLSGASVLLHELRVHKDACELAAIRQAQALTDAAFAHILTYIKPGVREIDVALELEFFMRKNGADGIAFETIAVSGSASSLPHGVPRDRVLEKGFLTMDFGARYGGYCADMTRTVVIGKADAEMKRLYATVLAAQQAAVCEAQVGCSLQGLDLCARAIIEDAGYRGCFGHSLGHGVGIDIHEAPRLSQRTDPAEKLAPGHVVTVEPGIYLEGKYGCRIEDMLAVDEQGVVLNLTASPKELIEL